MKRLARQMFGFMVGFAVPAVVVVTLGSSCGDVKLCQAQCTVLIKSGECIEAENVVYRSVDDIPSICIGEFASDGRRCIPVTNALVYDGHQCESLRPIVPKNQQVERETYGDSQ